MTTNHKNVPAEHAQFLKDWIVEGGECIAPTTASSQLTGTDGATDLNANVAECQGVIDGHKFQQALQADLDLDNGNTPSILQTGESRWYAYVVHYDVFAGAVAFTLVKADIAVTASAKRVSKALIEGAIGPVKYVRLWDKLCTRSADTTIAETVDNSVRFNTLADEEAAGV